MHYLVLNLILAKVLGNWKNRCHNCNFKNMNGCSITKYVVQLTHKLYGQKIWLEWLWEKKASVWAMRGLHGQGQEIYYNFPSTPQRLRKCASPSPKPLWKTLFWNLTMVASRSVVICFTRLAIVDTTCFSQQSSFLFSEEARVQIRIQKYINSRAWEPAPA